MHDPGTPDSLIARPCALRLDEHREHTPNGREIITRHVVAITGIPGDEPYKAYDLEDDVQAVVRVLARTPAVDARRFLGYLACESHSDTVDQWRLYVRTGYTVPVRPVLHWSDPAGPPVGY
ncbi:hypothetical protein LO763_22660 [Glycomyces sp. A-F 0318]|uniref:hypothetical protein n=1 Tax=Glycomyces amatae TaxID=2881355 RepID=UPI001E4F3683|nr:hypothetical protein [Glycomyces amatae]MCD0446422.1 hypothetical protein [Glycomyces amatae]